MNTTILSLNPNRKPSLLVTLLSFFLPTLTLVDAAHMEGKRDQFGRARRVMIERDLVSRGIQDKRVLEAMGSIERELFVPEKLRSLAMRIDLCQSAKGKPSPSLTSLHS